MTENLIKSCELFLAGRSALDLNLSVAARWLIPAGMDKIVTEFKKANDTLARSRLYNSFLVRRVKPAYGAMVVAQAHYGLMFRIC